MSLRVGVTGNMGSGKTLVCRIFAALGAPVYDADYWAKWLLSHDEVLMDGVRRIFGPKAYTAEGAYDRAFVAALAFAHPEKLEALNALAHPAVERHSRAWHERQAAAGHAYTVKEAALMIESGSHRFLDALVVVVAPEDLRIERVRRRDGVGEDEVRARLARQWPEAEKIALADYVVQNDGRHLLIPQVVAIHRDLQKKFGERANAS